jgi:hypothetical protein
VSAIELDGLVAWRAREIGMVVPNHVPNHAVLKNHSVSCRTVGWGADRHEYTGHYRWEWTIAMTCDAPDIVERNE